MPHFSKTLSQLNKTELLAAAKVFNLSSDGIATALRDRIKAYLDDHEHHMKNKNYVRLFSRQQRASYAARAHMPPKVSLPSTFSTQTATDQDPLAEAEGSDIEPERVESLWFPAETIVICAENKIFRVSGGILVARSNVFRDMLGLPQPPSSDIERIEGSPVVRLQDSAQDTEIYFMPGPAPFDLSDVLGILRLSHKYDVQYLYRRALDHLAMDGYHGADDAKLTRHLTSDFDDSPINALSVIVTAMEVEAPWLLPNAYYEVSTFSSDVLLPHLAGELAPHVQKCLVANHRLVRAELLINGFLTKRSTSDCASVQRCMDLRRQKLCNLLPALAKRRYSDPVFELGGVLEALRKKGMCKHCLNWARDEQQAAASAFWRELPDIFGLPPQRELDELQRAAMGDDAENEGTGCNGTEGNGSD
ncbi:hypothetical protein DFH06DRAFT_1329233 [Mycena polygramma]|nr:hypothetical protein DFH06DRAFT_1329233 [Mycena polygramma]